jgi:ParB family chromosome partitioning protein
MEYIEIETTRLTEHPDNKKFFNDISGEFWTIFVSDIEQNGIKTPLIVNQDLIVISGNQRLRAARKLGIETVPCIISDAQSNDEEIDDLIRCNVMQRDVDVFTKFKLVKNLQNKFIGRKGERTDLHDETTSVQNARKLNPRDEIAQILNENIRFITMGNIFNQLDEEKQEEVRRWFYEQDNSPTKKALNEKIRELAGMNKELEKTKRQMNYEIEQNQILSRQLKQQQNEYQKHITRLVAELKSARKLKLQEEQIKKITEELHALDKKKLQMLKDAEGVENISKALIRGKEFFVKECMIVQTLKLTDESKRLMKDDIQALISLVERWLDAVESKFII